MILQDLRKEIDDRKAVREERAAKAARLKKQIKVLKRELEHTEKARIVVQTVAQQTQENLQYRVSELVTLAMEAVFDDPYKLCLEFVPKRNKTEAVFTFERRGKKVPVKDSTGGGIIDVAAFALRASLWSLVPPPRRTRPVLFLDEPFKWINDPSRKIQRRACNMLKEVSDRMGLQMVVVSLLPEMREVADQVIEFSMKGGQTIV